MSRAPPSDADKGSPGDYELEEDSLQKLVNCENRCRELQDQISSLEREVLSLEDRLEKRRVRVLFPFLCQILSLFFFFLSFALLCSWPRCGGRSTGRDWATWRWTSALAHGTIWRWRKNSGLIRMGSHRELGTKSTMMCGDILFAFGVDWRILYAFLFMLFLDRDHAVWWCRLLIVILLLNWLN